MHLDQLRRLLGCSIGSGTILLVGFLVLAAPALAQYSVNTLPQWDGTNYISSFGVTDTATYGQVITVPAGATPLTSFTFEIGYCGASTTFRGEVYAWDGTKATGPALFESAPITNAGGTAFTLTTITVGGLTLPAGRYVLFASTSRDQAGAPSSACRWGAVPNASYTGGQFVYINNNTNVAAWTGSTWSSINEDLAMQVVGLLPPVPTVTSVTPASGVPIGGTQITITGTGFTGATSVTIGGAAATFAVVNDTTITATTPVGTPGAAVSVVVTTLGGSNAANSLFTYLLQVPTLTEWGMIGLGSLLAFYAWRSMRRQNAARPA